MILSINLVLGTHIMVREWVKVRKMLKHILKENPQIKDEIDRKLREKLGIFDGDVEENEDKSSQTLFDEE